MDITEFMSWFVNQVIMIFTKCFEILNSIEFMGTSLLKVLVTILILIPLLSVVLTINQDSERAFKTVTEHNDRVKAKNQKEYNKAEGIKK